MTAYDIFVIFCIIVSWPLILFMGILVWLLLIRLIIDIIKYGW